LNLGAIVARFGLASPYFQTLTRLAASPLGTLSRGAGEGFVSRIR
jgi:hypothetical protein